MTTAGAADGRAAQTAVSIPSVLVDAEVVVSGESLIQGLLDAAQDASVTVNADGVICFVNDAATTLFGYRGSELIGRDVEMLLPTAARMLHPALRRGYLAHPGAREMGAGCQVYAQRKDGTDFPVDIRLGQVELGGAPVVTATIRDVSERLSILNALQESDSLLRQLADSVEVAFILRALEPPEFLYVSTGYERIFGYNPMDVGEEPAKALSIIHPDDIDRFMVDYWALSKVGRPARAEYRIIRHDGRVRWVCATSVPVIDADGNVNRCAATVEDITERKLSEAELNAAYKNLEQANSAKDKFLSRMSHEFRTPLNAVLGFAQLLALDELSAEQRDSVEYILRGGRHLLDLIDDVLDFTAVASDRLQMSVGPTPVVDVVAEAVALIAPSADSMGVTVNYRATRPAEHYVSADRLRLRQVLVNLLSNAVKYNRREGTVDIWCAPGQGSLLDIMVRDTGRGIDPMAIPRLFTPFDRLGAEVTGIEGTGVGLALSQRLMASMGGTLTAHSDLGVGSTFIASIPVAARSPARPEQSLVAELAEADRAVAGALEAGLSIRSDGARA